MASESVLAAVRNAARMEAAAEDPAPADDEEDPVPADDEETADEQSTTTTVETTTTTGGGSEAARAERARVLGIQAAAFPGQEALANAMIADGVTTPEQAALRFNRALRAAAVETPAQLAQLAAMDRHVRVPANRSAAPAAGASAPAQTADGWKAEYAASPKLQAEFLSADSYVAYRQGEAAGRIKRLARVPAA